MRTLVFILFLFCSISVLCCEKELLVDIIHQKALPSMWDFSQKEYVKKNQVIKIDCELYKNISEGSILVPKDEDDVEINLRDALFGSPVEKVKYKVIKKL